jgi:hypothetical protein
MVSVNNFNPDEKAARRQVDVLPEPPTPIINALPRGILSTLEIVIMCYKAMSNITNSIGGFSSL